MADMFDCGMHEFRSWAKGDARSIRWYGEFDANRTAEEQWITNDSQGKLRSEAFAPFKRGWDAAKAEFAAHPSQPGEGA